MRARGNKYGAIKQTVGDKTFDSVGEAARYVFLKAAEDSGSISDLKCQVRFELLPKPNRIVYVADFQYVYKEEVIVEDFKGVETAVFKLKQKLFHHFYPDLKLIIVKSARGSLSSPHLTKIPKKGKLAGKH